MKGWKTEWTHERVTPEPESLIKQTSDLLVKHVNMSHDVSQPMFGSSDCETSETGETYWWSLETLSSPACDSHSCFTIWFSSLNEHIYDLCPLSHTTHRSVSDGGRCTGPCSSWKQSHTQHKNGGTIRVWWHWGTKTIRLVLIKRRTGGPVWVKKVH